MAESQPPKRAPKKYRAMGATRKTQYADETNLKYPIHDAKHVRAAISYFSNPRNANKYPAGKRARVWSRIRGAAKKFGVELGEGSGPPSLSKSIATLDIVPVAYTWMGYDLYPVDNGPVQMAQTAGAPPIVAVLGSNLAYDPYPLTWVFAMRLDDAAMLRVGAYYISDLEGGQDFKRALDAGSQSGSFTGNGAALRVGNLTHVLAPGHASLEEAREKVEKALPGHSVVDVGWPLYSGNGPCPTVMFHSLASGQDMMEIEPMHKSDEFGAPETSENPPMDGSRLYASIGDLMKSDDVFEEMQKSLRLMKSVVDMSFPFPDQKSGDGDHDADDNEDGESKPDSAISIWPASTSGAAPHPDPMTYFMAVGIDLGDIGAPVIPGQPVMEPAWAPGAHEMPAGPQFPSATAAVAGEGMYKCMECNEPMHRNMDGGMAGFCKGCGSYMNKSALPWMPNSGA